MEGYWLVAGMLLVVGGDGGDYCLVGGIVT